jgi:flavodoxin I
MKLFKVFRDQSEFGRLYTRRWLFMKAVVVYDSYFGNTEKIAQAIGSALAVKGDVSVVKASEASLDLLQGLDLIVVGSPTRAFSQSEGIKAFLDKLSTISLRGVKSAAFDTRMPPEVTNNGVYTFFSRIFGYAAPKIASMLKKKGCVEQMPPEGFTVMGSEGPLKDGELERAAEWGRAILEKI